jgi:hypothetical protein
MKIGPKDFRVILEYIHLLEKAAPDIKRPEEVNTAIDSLFGAIH